MCKVLQISSDRSSIVDSRHQVKYNKADSIMQGQGCAKCNEQFRCSILAIFDKKR